MFLNQARGILRFSKVLAGKKVRVDENDYNLFIFFVISPIYSIPGYSHVLKKMDLADGKSYLNTMIMRFQKNEKGQGTSLKELIDQIIFEFGCDEEDQAEQDFCKAVEKLSNKLRLRFMRKITELEKTLRSQLRRSMSDNRFKQNHFEHSGQKKTAERHYWTAGNVHWDVLYDNLATLDKIKTLTPPEPKTNGFPDTETALPTELDLRNFMVKVFEVLMHKLPFTNILDWLRQYKPYSPALRIDDPESGADKIESSEEPRPTINDDGKKLWELANKNLKKLKPQYQDTFKKAFLWHKISSSNLGYRELVDYTGIKKSTMDEHFRKHIFPKVIIPMNSMRDDLLEKFRKKFSEFNPEK